MLRSNRAGWPKRSGCRAGLALSDCLRSTQPERAEGVADLIGSRTTRPSHFLVQIRYPTLPFATPLYRSVSNFMGRPIDSFADGEVPPSSCPRCVRLTLTPLRTSVSRPDRRIDLAPSRRARVGDCWTALHDRCSDSHARRCPATRVAPTNHTVHRGMGSLGLLERLDQPCQLPKSSRRGRRKGHEPRNLGQWDDLRSSLVCCVMRTVWRCPLTWTINRRRITSNSHISAARASR